MRKTVCGTLAGAAALLALAPVASAAKVHVAAPARAGTSGSFGIHLTSQGLKSMAGFEVQVLVNGRAAEVGALVPAARHAQMLEVDGTRSAARLGFYGAKGTFGTAIGDVLITPHVSGRIQVRLVRAIAVDRTGRRIPVRLSRSTFTVRVYNGKRLYRAPAARHASVGVKRVGYDLSSDHQVTKVDLDTVAYNWGVADVSGGAVPALAGQDVDGNGQLDIGDIQAIASRVTATRRVLAAGQELTLTVNTTTDDVDAVVGDGKCLTAAGLCSLRAAMQEANYRQGPDHVRFNIPAAPGVVPVIQVNSALPVSDQYGGTDIDAYTQPGSHPNTLSLGSDAIPGVQINGYGDPNQGWGWKDAVFYVTSSRNLIRGFSFGSSGNPIYLFWTGAKTNKIVGNWFGFNATGTPGGSTPAYPMGYAAVHFNNAQANTVGTPLPADRNVVQGFIAYGMVHYGINDVDNKIQNNYMGFDPTGVQAYSQGCDAFDHNTGPKRNLTGGLNPGEGNVIGKWGCDAIEFSHGWVPGTDISQHGSAAPAEYRVRDNIVQGNWVGFYPDGHFSEEVRPGSQWHDDGSGINIIDNSDANTIEGNYITGNEWGISCWGPECDGNTIKNNHFGIAPNGGAAGTVTSNPDPGFPKGGWCILIWRNAKANVVTGNEIANCPTGGIGVDGNPSDGNLLSQNTFHDNGGLPIDIGPLYQWNVNDKNDVDAGPNQQQNSPVLTSATTTAVKGTVGTNTTVELYRTYSPVGQSGPGVEFLGTAVPNQYGNFTFTKALNPGDVITALDYDAAKNTSEFALNIAVPGADPNVRGVTYDLFSNVGGGTVLTDVPAGTLPTSTATLNAFSAPVNIGDSQGTRLRAILTAPTTGQYTFWVASDDQGEVSLSTDTNPANLAVIARVTAWTPEYTYDWFPEQQSAPITLQAGQKYYMDAFSKEGGGGDNLTVVWQTPGGTRQAIPATNLAPTSAGCTGWCPLPLN